MNTDFFAKLYDLRNKKKLIEDEIKKMEEVYKPKMERFDSNIEFEEDGYVVQVRVSNRKGSIDSKLMEADGLNVDYYRKDDTIVRALIIKRIE